MHTKRSYACHALAALAGLIVTVVMAQLLARNPVLITDLKASYVAPNDVTPGQSVVLTWRVVEKRNCEGRIIPRIIDSSGRVFEYAHVATAYHDATSSEPRTFSKSLTIPYGMAAGKARYDPIITRWCNLPQRLLWPMADPPTPIWFNVVVPVEKQASS